MNKYNFYFKYYFMIIDLRRNPTNTILNYCEKIYVYTYLKFFY